MRYGKCLLAWIGIAWITATYGMNVVRPYQILLRPPKKDHSWMQLYAVSQFGFATRAFGSGEEHAKPKWFTDPRFISVGDVDPLQIYQCNQDALAMFDGFPPCSAIGQMRVRLDAQDDGQHGHFVPCGNFYMDNATHMGLRLFFKHHLSLVLYQPYYKMRLTDVYWRNCASDISVQNARVAVYLSEVLAQRTCAFGDLDINGWSRSGFGDTTLSLEWLRDYPQQKPMLHNVTINGRLGGVFPSGLKTDENKILAFPFGNDGTYGIIFALGLDLFLGHYVKAGLDVQLMHQFGNARCRRIKTSVAQTDLLLLAKTDTYKDFGLTQQFSFYGQLYNAYGASCQVAYQFYKHGENTLYVTNNEYSTRLANSAESLHSYTTHDVFVMLNYDFSAHMSKQSYVTPYISAFVDIPFNGRRAIVAKTAGFVIALNF